MSVQDLNQYLLTCFNLDHSSVQTALQPDPCHKLTKNNVCFVFLFFCCVCNPHSDELLGNVKLCKRFYSNDINMITCPLLLKCVGEWEKFV